jgi:hypothetical protein
MNEVLKYFKYVLGGAFALQTLAVLMSSNSVLLTLLIAAVLGVAAAREFDLLKGKVDLCEAHVYKHLELGTLLYCDAAQATHTDYQYLGTAKVPCDKVGRCSLA